VLAEKQLQLLKLIRQAKEQADARDAATAAAAEAEAATGGNEQSSSRGLKRSRSVAWDSPTMHASSNAASTEQQAWSAAGSLSSTGEDGSCMMAAGQNDGAVAGDRRSCSSSNAVEDQGVRPLTQQQ
jgi:hypothetical protein